MHTESSHKPETHSMSTHSYGRLLLMLALSFASMYVLMYAMVNSFANVYASVNQFYMAALMSAPMAVIELLLMGGMYRNKKWNAMIVAAAILALAGFWMLIRQQAAVGDVQFLRSMIPHHGGAILMCKEAPLRDEKIKALCQSIISGQQVEIDQMKALLAELER